MESRSAPAKVLDQAAAVSAGAGSTAALLGDQTLWTWGDNLFGQLGDGTRASRSTPAKVLDQVTAVSMGGYHAAALRADGTLWLWGSNIDGQLGNGGQGNTTDQTGAQLQTLPLSLSTTGPVTAVSAGTSHTAVILADGSPLDLGAERHPAAGSGPDGPHRLSARPSPGGDPGRRSRHRNLPDRLPALR